MNQTQTIPPHVLKAYDQIAQPHRARLLEVRGLIFEAATTSPRIGAIEEALRWGEPAYITTKRKTGSTIRLGIERGSGLPAVFFNCNTTLVESFRAQFGSALRYSKNRAVLIDGNGADFETALKMCLTSALTYHLRPIETVAGHSG